MFVSEAQSWQFVGESLLEELLFLGDRPFSAGPPLQFE